MSPHLRKEIRCILPNWLMTVGSITLAGILLHQGEPQFLFPPLCAVLTALLAASSFGSEFHHKTMPILLLLPVERAELWRTKMIVLAAALLSVSAVVALMPVHPMKNYPSVFLTIAVAMFGVIP